MKRTLFLSIVVIFIISMVGCDNKLSTKELYQLQEQCGKSCKEYNEGRGGWYECHYNKKLNKCFYSRFHLMEGSELFDLHEHKCLGRCVDDSYNTPQKLDR